MPKTWKIQKYFGQLREKVSQMDAAQNFSLPLVLESIKDVIFFCKMKTYKDNHLKVNPLWPTGQDTCLPKKAAYVRIRRLSSSLENQIEFEQPEWVYNLWGIFFNENSLILFLFLELWRCQVTQKFSAKIDSHQLSCNFYHENKGLQRTWTSSKKFH